VDQTGSAGRIDPVYVRDRYATFLSMHGREDRGIDQRQGALDEAGRLLPSTHTLVMSVRSSLIRDINSRAEHFLEQKAYAEALPLLEREILSLKPEKTWRISCVKLCRHTRMFLNSSVAVRRRPRPQRERTLCEGLLRGKSLRESTGPFRPTRPEVSYSEGPHGSSPFLRKRSSHWC